MIYKILMAVFIVLFVLLLLTIAYLLFSKKEKNKMKMIRNKAKKERKQIIADGYKTISEQQKELETQKQETRKFISNETENLNLEKRSLNELRENLNNKEVQLDGYKKSLNELESDLQQKNNSLIQELEKVSGLDQKTAEDKLKKSVEFKMSNYISDYVKQKEIEAKRQAKDLASNYIVNAMEKYKTDIVTNNVTSIVELPNEKMKGRIIGKEGRNIKTFEQVSGVDVIIDETPDMIMISSFNPIRREIAVKALKALMNDGRIQPVKIEEEVKRQTELLNEGMLETGHKVLDELNIYDMNDDLAMLIGRLKYRTSYSQNVLAHSIEVAKIAQSLAKDLGLNDRLALRAGLLHDIGKSVDFEKEGTHVQLGKQIAIQNHENEIVINAIAAHHEDEPKTNMISEIVAIADAISASRPGARNNDANDFVSRMNDIEELLNKTPGVLKAFVVQSGRQIRVMVDPSVVSEKDIVDLKLTLMDLIKKNLTVPGDIVLTIIRETRDKQVIK